MGGGGHEIIAAFPIRHTFNDESRHNFYAVLLCLNKKQQTYVAPQLIQVRQLKKFALLKIGQEAPSRQQEQAPFEAGSHNGAAPVEQMFAVPPIQYRCA